MVSASRGKIDNAYVIKVMGTDRWRALFDLAAEGSAPVDLRLFLKLGDKTLSETWLYQYSPPPVNERDLEPVERHLLQSHKS